MKEFFSFLRNKKDLGNLILVGILVVSIPLTVGLVQRQQVLTSRAIDEIIKFTGPNVIVKEGKKIATKTKIAIQLSSPFGPPDYKLGNAKVRSFSPSIDFAGTVYGQEGEGDEGGDDGDDDPEAEADESDGSSDSEAETSTSEEGVGDGGNDLEIVSLEADEHEEGITWGFLGGDPEEKDENGKYVNWVRFEEVEFYGDGKLWGFLGGDPKERDENGNYVNWVLINQPQTDTPTCTDNCADSIPVVTAGTELQAISGLKTLSGYDVIIKTITDINGNERIVFLPAGNQFGAYDVRQMPQRPYSGIPYEELTDKMKAFVQRWEENPYYVVWKFEVDTGPENNWGGWGPPPKGWTNRIDIPHIVNDDGTWTYFGDALPWPPAGDPGDIGAWSDPLLLGSISAEEYASLTPDQIRQLNQQRMDELWAEVVKTASFGDEPILLPTPTPTSTRVPTTVGSRVTNLPGGEKTVQTQCNGLRSWNQICSELKNAGWPGNCTVGSLDVLDVYNRTSCGSKYVAPTTTAQTTRPPIESVPASVSKPPTTSASSTTTVTLGPPSPFTNYCATSTGANPICRGEPVESGNTCSFYQSCNGLNNVGGTMLCNSKVINGQCSRDPANVNCSHQCNAAVITQNSQSGSTSPLVSGAAPAESAQVTTTRYRISENPADLSQAPWVVYAAENTASSSKARWFAYTEPLIINLEFKDKSPGTKFFFVEFEDSNGKRGGCGADGARPCAASIVYDPTTSQVVNCKIENKSFADIFPSGKPDGFVNANDASFLIQQLSIAPSGTRADVNKDGVTDICDFSLIQTNYGEI